MFIHEVATKLFPLLSPIFRIFKALLCAFITWFYGSWLLLRARQPQHGVLRWSALSGCFLWRHYTCHRHEAQWEIPLALFSCGFEHSQTNAGRNHAQLQQVSRSDFGLIISLLWPIISPVVVPCSVLMCVDCEFSVVLLKTACISLENMLSLRQHVWL